MNRASGTFALIALVAGTIAAAQTAPVDQPTSSPSTMQSSQEPSSSGPPPSSTTRPAPGADTSGGNSGKYDQKDLTKDCAAQVRAVNPKMSESDAKKACKAQSNTSPKD